MYTKAHSKRTWARVAAWLVVGGLATTSVVGCDDKEKEAAAAKEKAEAEAKAAKEKVEAEAKAAHATAKAEVQKDFDAAGRKFDYLKVKAMTVTGAAKKNVDAAVTEVEKRREAANAALAKMDSASGAAWDTAKAEAKTAVDALKAAVENVEPTIMGKPAPAKK